MSEAALRTEGLAKRYPSGAGILTVFENLTLALREGESVAVVGASGAGKSTLLHLLGALDRPSEGRIFSGSLELTAASEPRLADYRNAEVGYVWQSYYLLPEFTALENVAFPLWIAGWERKKAEPVARDWLDKVGLAARATHQAGELSGGEQQRVAIARALVRGPKLLLADEPTGNLDSVTGDAIMSTLLELPRSAGLTLVMATHNLGYAARCDRVLRIERGRLIEQAAETPGPLTT